jgi:hypothetical protein
MKVYFKKNLKLFRIAVAMEIIIMFATLKAMRLKKLRGAAHRMKL